MDAKKFSRIAESLRQYRRADLTDFQAEVGSAPIDALYVDPLPGGAILDSVLSSNTTFLLGRKGTGKSTVFAKAQSVLRARRDVLSAYIDVKALYELSGPQNLVEQSGDSGVNPGICRAHLVRKEFLGHVLAELITEIDRACETMSVVERFKGVRRSYLELQSALDQLRTAVRSAKLHSTELPILQKINKHWRTQTQQEASGDTSVSTGVDIGPASAKIRADATVSDFDRTLEDSELYQEYSEVVVRTLPFNELLSDLQDLLAEAGMRRLVVFFDDFSELAYLDQRLFVDVVLAPLNNSSNERVKLKIAGYPGRVYYGKIDPGKVDTISLDFSALYEAVEVQEMERSAIDYAVRLLRSRFEAFGTTVEEYFDGDFAVEYAPLVFQTTFNVPRLMGSLLSNCYLDRISKGVPINQSSLRLAARKYYESTVSQYFDRMFRYALEPFENKLDRHNQRELLDFIVNEARNVRKKILDGSIGGSYFEELSNPPVSHFVVTPKLEAVLSSLESNFLLSKYKDTRDKNGVRVAVYALYYGLTESERMTWGYPSGREYRNYFVQRCFDYTRAIQEFLSRRQTIRCSKCGSSFPLDQRESFELYGWACPECKEAGCKVVDLAEDFAAEVRALQQDTMLEPIELEILNVLNEEREPMRAGEISALVDVTYQLVGRRTSKLQDFGLIEKSRGDSDGHMRSSLAERAKAVYFGENTKPNTKPGSTQNRGRNTKPGSEHNKR